MSTPFWANPKLGPIDQDASMIDSSSKQSGQILRRFREDKRLSRAALASAAGTTPGQIQKLENGERKLTIEWMERIGPALGKSVADFVALPPLTTKREGKDHPPNEGDIIEVAGDKFAKLSIYDIKVAQSANFETANGNATMPFHLINLSRLRAISETPLSEIWSFEVPDDSNSPILEVGDLVTVDSWKKSLRRPGIYALNVDGQPLIKYCSQHLETGAITLVSENPRYEPMVIRHPENLLVLGRVIYSIRRL